MTQDNLQINSAAITDKGLSEKRPQNEDSYLELRDSGLYAVADGVGGAQAGDVASQMAMEILGEAFINLQEDGDAEERMKSAIEQANSAIFQTSNELAQLSTMATTIVALHINGNIATIGHVGDSRLYRLDGAGNLFRETQDHSVVEEEVRAGRMTPEQALTHPSRNVISRALGAEQNVEIDMKTIMFEPNTKFLVCSDGVTRHIPDEELRSLLMEEDDNFLICRTIRELCFERGAEDNLTAVVASVMDTSQNEYFDGAETISDFEEDTVANARPPLVNSAVLGATNAEVQEIPTQQLQTHESAPSQFSGNDNDSPEIEEVKEEEIIIPTNEQIGDDTMSIANSSETISEREPTAKKDIKSYRVEDKSGMGILGSIISGLLWLLIGAVIGAMGYHYWMKSSDVGVGITSQPAQVIQTNAIFEQNKRLAITDPKTYTANNVNPKSAYDNYLLGLAFTVDGNFDSAKREFEKAEALLDKVPENDRAVLKHDIDLALNKINQGTEKLPAVDDDKEVKNSGSGVEAEAIGQPISDLPVGSDG